MVNQQFTFAVHILTVLAFSPGEVIGSQRLAASIHTNPVVVRRLLLALRQAKLIETFPGKHGGVRLCRPAESVSLMDIYDSVEPRPVIRVSERRVFKACQVSCNMKKIMSVVAESTDEAVRRHLRHVTLAQLVRKVR